MRDTLAIITGHFGTRPFTTAQAREAGLTHSAVRHALRARRIQRLAHGVYQRAGDPNYLDRVRTAALQHPDAVLILDGAAALHGMWCPWPWGWRGVTMAATRAHRRYGTARLIRRRIPDQDVAIVDGVRVTTPARTALDIATQATLAEALVAVDSFGRLTEPTRQQTLLASFRDGVRSELLTTAGRMGGIRGVDRARYAAALANPAAESAPESYARGLFMAAGHPEPEVGRPVRGADGRTYYADLVWPEVRRIVEVDGALKYDDRSANLAEKRREDALRQAGYTVDRIMAGELWRTGLAAMGRQAA